jgi:hypothetical protein
MRLKTFLIVLTLGAGLAAAEVVDSAANGFTVKTTLNIKASPDDVYNKLVHNIGDWWNPAHTFSQNAANLRIEDHVGGCLCEKLPNNGFVRHLELIYLAPGKALTFSGAMGPFQSMAVSGTMVITLAPADGGTKFEMSYLISGYIPKGMNQWPGLADMMTAEQCSRLKRYVETGTAAPSK